MSSTLTVSVVSAVLTRDTETFSNMDPYVIVECGNEKRSTRVHEEGGKKPHWKDQFTFNNPKANVVKFTVMDKDVVSDDKVGEGSLNLGEVMGKPNQQLNEHINLNYKGKAAGRLNVGVRYVNGGSSGNNNMHGNNNSNWGGNNMGNNNQNSNWGGNNMGGNNQNSNWGGNNMGGNNQNSIWGGNNMGNNMGQNNNSNWGGNNMGQNNQNNAYWQGNNNMGGNQQQGSQWGGNNMGGNQQQNGQWGGQNNNPNQNWGNGSNPNNFPSSDQNAFNQLSANLLGGGSNNQQQNSQWGGNKNNNQNSNGW